jgi:hypothetical protein
LNRIFNKKKANMQTFVRPSLLAVTCILSNILIASVGAAAQTGESDKPQQPTANSRWATEELHPQPESANYKLVQRRLAQGWNTWDVHSVTTHVLLPEGLAIHVGLKHNATGWGDAFLQDALIGRLEPGAEQVVPGAHSWDGSYTDLRISWKGHNWRVQSAREGSDLTILATPLPSEPTPALPPTIVFTVDFLWNLPGTTLKHPDFIETHGASGAVPIYCTCKKPQGQAAREFIDLPLGGPHFAADLTEPVGVSTGKRHTLKRLKRPLRGNERRMSNPRRKRANPDQQRPGPKRQGRLLTRLKPLSAGTQFTSRADTGSSPR